MNLHKMPEEAIVFVSHKCPHSNEIAKLITELDLKIKINIVDVKSLDKIPSFIDRVPLLLTHDENIYHDEELFTYIKSQEISVEPFMLNEMQGMSDYYSFMGEDEDKQLDHVYSFLDKEEELITNTKGIGDEESDRIVNYEKYMETRADDIKDILKQQTPAAA